MFAKTADSITKKLQENNSISSEQYEICRFGFQQGLTIVLNTVTILAIGAVMKELWQAMLFMALYAPLRSNAGGYHARTATLCYVYSILLMIAVLLAMKYLFIPEFICIVALVISCVVIFILAPVEDANKPLDDIEQVVYKRRAYVITALETIIFFITLFYGEKQITICVMWVFLMMSGILMAGKCKNGLNRTSDNVHGSERMVYHE